MQAITIIVILSSYVFLLFQYRRTANSGARDIAEALIEKNSLHLLNKRMPNTTPLMLLSLTICCVTQEDSFLRFGWNGKLTSGLILFFCLCFLVSVYSGLQSKEKLSAAISIGESRNYLSLRVPGLIIYEIFFRGVLLGISLEWFSTPFAVALNIILYAIAHAFSSRKEFIGSIVFGLLLCYITILFDSILPAIILHLGLALPYESILLTKCQLLTKKIKS